MHEYYSNVPFDVFPASKSGIQDVDIYRFPDVDTNPIPKPNPESAERPIDENRVMAVDP